MCIAHLCHCSHLDLPGYLYLLWQRSGLLKVRDILYLYNITRKYLFATDHYGLNARVHHCTVSVGDTLYIWAGGQVGLPRVHNSEEKRKLTSNIQHFTPSTGQWVSRATTGTPPLGVSGYSCTAIDDRLYYFGGWCGHPNCYHNSITQLDTVSLQWRELESTDATRPVMMRAYGRMISLEHDGVHHLLMIGGVGSEPAVQLPNAEYSKLKEPNVRWRTSEHSVYNLSSSK